MQAPPLIPPPTPPSRPRSGALILGSVAVAAVLAIAAVLVNRASHGSGSLPASAVPGVTLTPGPGGCLDAQQARAVWADVNSRLDDLALHPDLSKLSGVARGTAADALRTYLQDTLISKHLTEREHERLDDLGVVQPGCGDQPLTVRLTETLVQDDYLAPDGHVDHRDPGVGETHHLLESFVRDGGVWKVITIAPLDAPSQDQGQVV